MSVPTTSPPTSAGSRTLAAVRTYLALVVAGVLFVAPVYYLVIGSFKPPGEVLDGLNGFVLAGFTLENYHSVFDALSADSTGYFGQFLLNSFLISLGIVLGGLVVNSMAGYALARLEWIGQRFVLLFVIALVIVPFESVAVPLLFLLQDQRNTLAI